MATLQEKLEAIRGYDGVTNWNTKTYLKSLDWLHPVAMKVIDELFETIRLHKVPIGDFVVIHMLADDIFKRCSLPPNSNGEYTDLFNAVYEGIQFINQYKIK